MLNLLHVPLKCNTKFTYNFLHLVFISGTESGIILLSRVALHTYGHNREVGILLILMAYQNMQFIHSILFLKVPCPQNLHLRIVHMDKTHNFILLLKCPGTL